ncbi:transmembrane protein [Legionella beliardensis]|uniref:Transmembrane protein n=1 Tax=Legionella beliardensis TaxID=91822 RepID=A0A378I2C5_9GAMM|nr:hypothetical protein [Legionella beliardensis]STX29102.1 transmembrane protein [Legionella beliardensis]
MEHDRYQHNKMLFIISIASLIIGLTLLAFSLYILPNLIWDLNYDVPSFIYLWSESLKQNYNFTNIGARLVVFLIFFIPAILATFIAYLTSNTIENELYGFTPPEREFRTKAVKDSSKETLLVTLQLLIIIGLVIAGVYSIHWLLSVPP